MKKRNRKKKPFSIKQRIRYWFDKRVANGSLGLIRALIAGSVAMALLLAGLILLFGLQGDSEPAAVLWDSVATVINAWMPYYEDGSVGYLIVMSVTAVAGVLFTSVLIGIVTSAIEDRINELKKGNSFVPEEGHIVVLGFRSGEYTLLRQLILAGAGEPVCIVLGEDTDRAEMEQDLKDNLDLPKNVRIITRTVDITDPVSIEKCSVETCRTVVVSPMEDTRATRAVLAVTTLLRQKRQKRKAGQTDTDGSGDTDTTDIPEVRVSAVLSGSLYRFPASFERERNVLTLHMNDILARMIAHSCAQTGISDTFHEVFNFEGAEFYLTRIPGVGGRTFGALMTALDCAVPVGVVRDGETILNPPAAFALDEDDGILVFSEEKDSRCLDAERSGTEADGTEAGKRVFYGERAAAAAIIGCNASLGVILRELPNNVTYVTLAGLEAGDDEREELLRIAHARNTELEFYPGSPDDERTLRALAQTSEHVILLNDHDSPPETADTDVMFRLLHLRELREKSGMEFNMTVELQKEYNQNLVEVEDSTDFLVSSSMASLFLAQLAESPELADLFREILSNEGNELYLKNAGTNRLTGRYTVRDLRRTLLSRGYVLLGYRQKTGGSRFTLSLNEDVTLTEGDDVIVLGTR